MKNKTTYILGLALTISIIFNVYASKHHEPKNHDIKALNFLAKKIKDRVIITFDEEGNTEIIGPNGQKAIKDFKIGDERPIDILKYTEGKPIKKLDTITIFSYNPRCVWQDSRIRCY